MYLDKSGEGIRRRGSLPIQAMDTVAKWTGDRMGEMCPDMNKSSCRKDGQMPYQCITSVSDSDTQNPMETWNLDDWHSTILRLKGKCSPYSYLTVLLSPDRK